MPSLRYQGTIFPAVDPYPRSLGILFDGYRIVNVPSCWVDDLRLGARYHIPLYCLQAQIHAVVYNDHSHTQFRISS